MALYVTPAQSMQKYLRFTHWGEVQIMALLWFHSVLDGKNRWLLNTSFYSMQIEPIVFVTEQDLIQFSLV